jgi:peroxiredoxin
LPPIHYPGGVPPRIFNSSLAAVVALLLLGGASSRISLAHSDGDESNEFFSTVQDIGKEKEMSRSELDFRLVGLDERSHSLSEYRMSDAVVLLAYSESCEGGNEVFRVINSMAGAVTTKKLRFVAISSDTDSPRYEMQERWRKARHGKIDLLFDPVQIVSRSLGFNRIGDFAIVDPGGMKVLSQGTVSELPSKLNDSLFNKDLKASRTSSDRIKSFEKRFPRRDQNKTCEIHWDRLPQQNFRSDFLPHFSRICLRCHVAGYAMDIFRTVDDLRGWREMSLKTIRLMRMPGVDRSELFPENGARKDQDLRRIVQWLEQPTAITDEDRAEFLQARNKAVQRIQSYRTPKGEPDLVFEIEKPIEVPRAGDVPYAYVKLSDALDSDLLIQGVSLTSNLNVVHHVNVFASSKVLSPDEIVSLQTSKEKKGLLTGLHGRENVTETPAFINGKKWKGYRVQERHIVTFSRRKGVTFFEKGLAIRVPKGSYLYLQIHLNPSGKPEKEKTKIGIYLWKEKTAPQVIQHLALVPEKFVIPPKAAHFVVRTETSIDRPIRLLSYSFHMHYRGVAAQLILKKKNSKKEIVLASNPYFQFKIAIQEAFPKPVLIPSGSKLISVITYDNSELNSANPDPKRAVPLGSKTFTNEMHYPRINYVEDEVGNVP